MVTQRDLVWATVLDIVEWRRSFTVRDVHTALDESGPTERTVRNTLDAMETMGVLECESGAGRAPSRYYFADEPPKIGNTGYSPRESSSTNAFPYPGGKGQLSQWIIGQMPVHDTYVEVFGGGAAVLLNKPKSKYEIYNDLNDDLAQFFRVLRDQSDELAEWLHSVPYSRRQYERWVDSHYRGQRPDDPVARAGRYFSLRYMQIVGESSTANGFKTRARRSPARTFDNARKRLQAISQRFEQVTIESRDFEKILRNYDSDSVDVLFYVDPPYVGSEGYYGGDFDHEALVSSLGSVENDWIVSYTSLPEGLDEYTVIERQHRHRMQRRGVVTEKLVCNFEPTNRTPFVENTDVSTC